MNRARRFYESVFEVVPSFASSGWTTLNFDSFELALHILSPNHMDESPLPNAGLNLEVDQIEQMQALIESIWREDDGTQGTRPEGAGSSRFIPRPGRQRLRAPSGSAVGEVIGAR